VYANEVRNVTTILALLVAVFAGAALLAPLAWMAVAPNDPSGGIGLLKFLKTHDDFHRYFSRCLLLLALIGLAVQCKFAGIRSWADVGWTAFSGNARQLGYGLLIGMASIVFIITLGILLGTREFTASHTLAEWSRHLGGAVGAAVAVAIIEETLFRGMFFNLLRRDLSLMIAAVASSVIYSAVHFFNQRPAIDEVTWATGFTAFPEFLPDAASLPIWLPHFVNLTLAGLILAGVFARTGNLYCAIGIHAGWILLIKTGDFMTQSTLTPASPWWGDGRLMNGMGWSATPLLAAMAWFTLRRDDGKPEKPTD